MNLLLTNDDGYNERGLMILASELRKEHNVFILAPEANRSAVSHCITMTKPLTLKKMADNEYTCSGFPADCAIIGLKSNLFPKIDALISGINYGANIGTDVIYSGTCAAARQAVIYGVPGIALSVEFRDSVSGIMPKKADYKFDAMAKFARENLSELMKMAATTYPYLFVNCNGLSIDSYKGMKEAKEISVRHYGDYIKLDGPEYNIRSIFYPGQTKTLGSEESDYAITNDGYVSVSRIYAEPVIGI